MLSHHMFWIALHVPLGSISFSVNTAPNLEATPENSKADTFYIRLWNLHVGVVDLLLQLHHTYSPVD